MTYYIVYMAENAVGTYAIKRRRPIKTIDDVKTIADLIKEDMKFSQVLVLDWKKLKR